MAAILFEDATPILFEDGTPIDFEGDFGRHILVWVNSVNVTDKVDRPSIHVTESLFHRVDTARFRMRGVYPTEGEPVQIQFTNNGVRFFHGTIQNRRQQQVHRQQRVWHHVDAIDSSRLLGRRLVTKTYTSWRVDSIAHDLVANYSSGFTKTGIQAINSVIGRIEFTAVPLPKALTRLAQRIGVSWKISPYDDVEFGDLSGGSQLDLDDAATHFWDLEYSKDLSQVRTRVFVEGNGATVPVGVAASTNALPVSDATYFSDSGGQAKVQTDIFSYGELAGTAEGGTTAGFIAPPTAIRSFSLNAGASGSLTLGATYRFARSWLTDEGETTPGAILVTQTHAGSTARRIVLNGFDATSETVLGQVLYCTSPNATSLKILTSFGPTIPLDQTEIFTTTSLTGDAPTVNTAGLSRLEAPAGSNSLLVAECGHFEPAGWIEGGNQIVRYTSKSVSSGTGYLLGIPSSGPGALTAPFRTGTIKAVPFLNSIPGTAIRIDVAAGAPVQLVVQRNDTSAQSVMAALEGGDGIHEYWIQDRRLNETSAQERGEAELLLFASPEHSGSYKTRSESVLTGQFAIINLTSPTAIQSVSAMQQQITYSDFQNSIGPIRTVEFSTHYRDFFDVIGELEDPGGEAL